MTDECATVPYTYTEHRTHEDQGEVGVVFFNRESADKRLLQVETTTKKKQYQILQFTFFFILLRE